MSPDEDQLEIKMSNVFAIAAEVAEGPSRGSMMIRIARLGKLYKLLRLFRLVKVFKLIKNKDKLQS
jgi:hypothetical protein